MEIKNTIHAINSNFHGAEHFTEPVDHMKSIDQIMGFIMPYMPVSLEKRRFSSKPILYARDISCSWIS